MALLKNNKYIKLFENGTYEIYASKEDRLKMKETVSFEIILDKYKELRLELDRQIVDLIKAFGYTEAAMSDPSLHNELMALPGIKELCEKLDEINTEAFHYCSELHKKRGTTRKFPIMAKYYDKVEYSIPNIVESGGTTWESTTLEKIYAEAKKDHIFGETEDC